MAGFAGNTALGKIRNRFVDISRFGMKFDDLMIKNSNAIGFIEGELRKRSGSSGIMADDLMRYSLAISDTTSKLKGKTLAFFQLDYIVKREKLRDVASNSEIEFVLDNIADDTIIYDENNRFCKPSNLHGKFRKQIGPTTKEGDLQYNEEIKQLYLENFDKIYSAWGFDSGISAWQYFYQFLIEGHLSFEILYDNVQNPKEIIGFKELDPALLYPVVQKDHEGKIYLEWLQKDEATGGHRTLADSQVIYISYSNFFRTKRVSFVERMLRSFNLLRILEHSKVIWHVMYAPLRLKTEVPVGSKSIQKAREDVSEFLNTFREDIFFSNDSGELKVDGQPRILFYKNYIVPVNDRGEKINIEPLEYTGPNFDDDQLLNYFLKKLKLDSKLPMSRWEHADGGGSFIMGPDGVHNEEVTYNKFIRRLRAGYQEILIKPWYIQMCLDNESLKDDITFKNAMGIQFVEENKLQKIKEQEFNAKGAETIDKLKELQKDDGSKMFSNEFLAKRYLEFDENDLQENENLLKEAEIKSKDKKEEGDEGAEGGAEGGFDEGDEGGFEEGGAEGGEEGGEEEL
jgi:hypothetical protein